jgi:hypothetical protein
MHLALFAMKIVKHGMNAKAISRESTVANYSYESAHSGTTTIAHLACMEHHTGHVVGVAPQCVHFPGLALCGKSMQKQHIIEFDTSHAYSIDLETQM